VSRKGTIAWLVAALAAGACVGIVAWLRWWPYSDNRQNLAVIGVGLLIAIGVVAWAVLLTTKPGFRNLVGLILAIALIGVAAFTTFVLSTAWACGDCPVF